MGVFTPGGEATAALTFRFRIQLLLVSLSPSLSPSFDFVCVILAVLARVLLQLLLVSLSPSFALSRICMVPGFDLGEEFITMRLVMGSFSLLVILVVFGPGPTSDVLVDTVLSGPDELTLTASELLTVCTRAVLHQLNMSIIKLQQHKAGDVRLTLAALPSFEIGLVLVNTFSQCGRGAADVNLISLM